MLFEDNWLEQGQSPAHWQDLMLDDVPTGLDHTDVAKASHNLLRPISVSPAPAQLANAPNPPSSLGQPLGLTSISFTQFKPQAQQPSNDQAPLQNVVFKPASAANSSEHLQGRSGSQTLNNSPSNSSSQGELRPTNSSESLERTGSGQQQHVQVQSGLFSDLLAGRQGQLQAGQPGQSYPHQVLGTGAELHRRSQGLQHAFVEDDDGHKESPVRNMDHSRQMWQQQGGQQQHGSQPKNGALYPWMPQQWQQQQQQQGAGRSPDLAQLKEQGQHQPGSAAASPAGPGRPQGKATSSSTSHRCQQPGEQGQQHLMQGGSRPGGPAHEVSSSAGLASLRHLGRSLSMPVGLPAAAAAQAGSCGTDPAMSAGGTDLEAPGLEADLLDHLVPSDLESDEGQDRQYDPLPLDLPTAGSALRSPRSAPPAAGKASAGGAPGEHHRKARARPRVSSRAAAAAAAAGDSARTNAAGGSSSKTSRFRGVYLGSMSKWVAEICHAGTRYRLGTFDSQEQAARAYDAAALKLKGPTAFMNFKDSVQLGLAQLPQLNLEAAQVEQQPLKHKRTAKAVAAGSEEGEADGGKPKRQRKATQIAQQVQQAQQVAQQAQQVAVAHIKAEAEAEEQLLTGPLGAGEAAAVLVNQPLQPPAAGSDGMRELLGIKLLQPGPDAGGHAAHGFGSGAWEMPCCCPCMCGACQRMAAVYALSTAAACTLSSFCCTLRHPARALCSESPPPPPVSA
jgi:hypothetical protein